MRKVFLDANVVLDFLDSTREAHTTAVRLFDRLIDRRYGIATSEDILTTVYYVMKEKNVVLDFFAYILREWEIVSFGSEILSKAVVLCRGDDSLDFEDVCQALAAVKSGCDAVISNDAGFYRPAGVSLIRPDEFLADPSLL